MTDPEYPEFKGQKELYTVACAHAYAPPLPFIAAQQKSVQEATANLLTALFHQINGYIDPNTFKPIPYAQLSTFPFKVLSCHEKHDWIPLLVEGMLLARDRNTGAYKIELIIDPDKLESLKNKMLLDIIRERTKPLLKKQGGTHGRGRQ